METAKEPGLLKWRRLTLLISMIGMLAGLLFSRALLSSSLIVFFITSFCHRDISLHFKGFISSPVLWSMSLLFFVPCLSGLWSAETAQWIQILRIKLPLVALPLCFAGIDCMKKGDWEKLAYAFLVLVFCGASWSILKYLQDLPSVHAGYLRAHTLTTPMGNDHVRFGLLMTIGILTAAFMLWQTKNNRATLKRLMLWAMILFYVIYEHILAARTGLFCLYLSSAVLIIWQVWSKRISLKSLSLIGLIVLLPVAAYFTLPTFRNRVKYFNYDLSFAKQNVYVPGSNDGNRIASIKAGWSIMNSDPVVGVGFGDIRKESDDYYFRHFPQMHLEDKILPSSEWMIYGGGSGWAGLIVFSFVMFASMFGAGLNKNIYWIILTLSISLSYIFDIGLEVQFGVFLHAFVLLWWYKWLQSQK